MKNIYLFGIIASLLIFSTVAFVYARNTDSGIATNNNYYSEDGMNKMHNEMMRSINDSELINEMNEMHESCIQSVKGEEYTAVRGNMMGNYGMIKRA